MATDPFGYGAALLGYDLSQRAKDADDRRRQLAQLQAQEAQAGAQNRQLAGQQALQGQEIGGRRQLAQDQFGYNTALQQQEIGATADQNHARFQHDDELFERHQAGSLAEMHLQQMQQEKMAKFQAGQEQQRLDQQQGFADYQQQQQYDFQSQENLARQTHETALHQLALQGQEARDELLHRYDTDQLGEQHRWRAEELKQAEQAKLEEALNTHISTGVQKGLMYYPPEAVQDMANLESQRRKVQNSPYLNDQQKQEWDANHYLPRKQQLFRSAVPKPATSEDWPTTVSQIEPDPTMRQFYTRDKTGQPVFDRAKSNYALGVQKLKMEQQKAQQPKPQTPAQRLGESEKIRKTVDARVKDSVNRFKQQITGAQVDAAADEKMDAKTLQDSIEQHESVVRPMIEQQVQDEMQGDQDGQQSPPAGESASPPAQAGSQATQATQAWGNEKEPVQIKSDAEFEELPPGSIYVGPDGIKRRK